MTREERIDQLGEILFAMFENHAPVEKMRDVLRAGWILTRRSEKVHPELKKFCELVLSRCEDAYLKGGSNDTSNQCQ